MAQCGCGRSETGECVGLHKLTTQEWLKLQKEEKERKSPEFLAEGGGTV